MTERRTIGQILTELGRVSEDDVATALEHQRDSGGYFGEALLACGFVSQEELEWGLASQFDLPYVFPDADSIDMEAASMVSPEWALAHLTLPIMKTEDSLTVVVESPMKTAAVDELHARTDLEDPLDGVVRGFPALGQLRLQLTAGPELCNMIIDGISDPVAHEGVLEGRRIQRVRGRPVAHADPQMATLLWLCGLRGAAQQHW